MSLTSGPSPAKPAARINLRYRMMRTVGALVLREMGARYGRSPGGYIWAILQPMGIIGILSVAFSLVARSPSLGNSFILFFGTGYTVFHLYSGVEFTIMKSLRYSRNLLNYPIVGWVDAIVARFLLNTLTGILVTYLVLAIIILTLDDPIVLNLSPIIEACLAAVFLGLGVGTLNCVLAGFSVLWDQIWGIISRPLFLLSGVIFLYEDMPPLAQEILWYNPIAHVIGMMRRGFYPTYEAVWVNLYYVFGWSLVTLFLGIVFLRRYHREILSR